MVVRKQKHVVENTGSASARKANIFVNMVDGLNGSANSKTETETKIALQAGFALSISRIALVLLTDATDGTRTQLDHAEDVRLILT